MKSDLFKLLICILIIIFLYNCINLKESKNIEGFETLSSEEIKDLKEELKKLKDDVINNKIKENIPNNILQKDLYDNENIRKYINYIVRCKYLALFLEENDRDGFTFMKNSPKIEYYEDIYENTTKADLYTWISHFHDALLIKFIFELLLPVRDLDENKILYKKTVNNIMSEITSKITEEEKEEVDEKNVNIYLDAEINEEKNIPTNYLLGVDIDEVTDSKVTNYLRDKFKKNLENFKSRRKPDSKPALNLSEFIELVKKDDETKKIISKTIKNAKKMADEINKGIFGNENVDLEEIGVMYNTYLYFFIMISISTKKLFNELKQVKNEYKDNLEAITRISNNTTSISSRSGRSRISNGSNNKVGSFVRSIFR